MTRTDVLIAGAGPGGCAAALAFVRSGARVTLIGPKGTPERGLFGEWLHPAGVTTLRDLGVELDGEDFQRNDGFVVHPGTGRAPIRLGYVGGTAVSMPHHVLVERLREAAAARPEVTVRLGARLLEATPDGTAHTSIGVFEPDLLVGADGRASVVRRAVAADDVPGVALSTTAGFELADVALPVERHGHVFLGGPGTALAYRLAPGLIRLNLDIAPGRLAPAEALDYLRTHYAPVLPAEIRDAFLDVTARQPVIRWAANRFRRKLRYGHEKLALVGDAVGFGHPLAAHGMTMAVMDAECLGRSSGVAAYASERRRRTWAPERLGIALHRAFTDTGSLPLREALFWFWQNDPDERDRMMRLLAVQVTSRAAFSRAVAQIARVALSSALGSGTVRSRYRSSIGLARWLGWLLSPEPSMSFAQRSPTTRDLRVGP
ncbi:FAD-dependent monooxygenase [Amycolatopsis japonica]|uniref:FAD-dependent monooxygenase n=1 Tax=Amycolatopsis japonica TaxID=208439 RepID=UPI00366CEA98